MRARVYDILSQGDTGPLLDNEIWAGTVPEGRKRPYLVWRNAFSVLGNSVNSGTPCTIERTFDLIVYADKFSDLRDIESAIISDVAEHGYVVGLDDGWDEDVKAFYLLVSVEIYDK